MGREELESPIGRHQYVPLGSPNTEIARQLGERAHAHREERKVNPDAPDLLATEGYQNLLSQLKLGEVHFTKPDTTGESPLY